MSDGVFTQPGPDGIFGRGGPPGDSSSPPIDADDTPLRETIAVAYPSPGHMRVARVIRHPKSGKVEFQEEYREPSAEEVQFLKAKGVSVKAGSMVGGTFGGLGEPVPPVEQSVGEPSTLVKIAKVGAILAAGAAGYWAVNKWVVPMFAGSNADAADADDVDDADAV